MLPIRDERPSVLFQGTEGTLDLARDNYIFQPNKGKAVQVAPEKSLEEAHTANFISAIIGNKPVSAPVQAGIDACRPMQMALKAYWENRLIKRDELSLRS